jgi:hypothetical protein
VLAFKGIQYTDHATEGEIETTTLNAVVSTIKKMAYIQTSEVDAILVLVNVGP